MSDDYDPLEYAPPPSDDLAPPPDPAEPVLRKRHPRDRPEQPKALTDLDYEYLPDHTEPEGYESDVPWGRLLTPEQRKRRDQKRAANSGRYVDPSRPQRARRAQPDPKVPPGSYRAILERLVVSDEDLLDPATARRVLRLLVNFAGTLDWPAAKADDWARLEAAWDSGAPATGQLADVVEHLATDDDGNPWRPSPPTHTYRCHRCLDQGWIDGLPRRDAEGEVIATVRPCPGCRSDPSDRWAQGVYLPDDNLPGAEPNSPTTDQRKSGVPLPSLW